MREAVDGLAVRKALPGDQTVREVVQNPHPGVLGQAVDDHLRQAALRQAHRELEPGGPIAVAVGLVRGYVEHEPPVLLHALAPRLLLLVGARQAGGGSGVGGCRLAPSQETHGFIVRHAR